MTYEQALAFVYGRINYEQRSPKPSDLKLDRIHALLGLLGDPHKGLRIVHVAGSKGKGSTAAMLAAILQRAGYRTGLFTSPHLVRFEERIQVNGRSIRPEDLAALVEKLQPAVARLDAAAAGAADRPTFFELATALGFLHFARHAEVAVVEVGLGGRFDSTNVCTPLVSVITSISYDHTQQLGNRLASIAMEKAGIVKPGRPAVSGATVPEARRVIERICGEREAPLRQLGVDFLYGYEPGRITAESEKLPRVRVFASAGDAVASPWMKLGLHGEHQAANAAVAVTCVEALRREGLTIPESAVAGGLAKVRWPARLEVLGRRPFVVLDCAHNVASVQALVDTLTTSFPPCRRILVFAASGDKDVAGIFRVLAPHFQSAVFTRFRDSPRALPPEKVAEMLRGVSTLPCTIAASGAEAFQKARAAAGEDDLICVTGSVFLAGELRPLIETI